ncbi:MAG: hypothetical protein V3U27_21420 [Candidatus Tectomicrobia bacterium]
MNDIRTDMAFGFQISDLRLVLKRRNRMFGSRLQVRDQMPTVLVTGKDRLGRATSIEGSPAEVLSIIRNGGL